MFFIIDFNFNTLEWVSEECNKFLFEYSYLTDKNYSDRVVYVGY